MRALRSENGQSAVFALLFLTVILGLAALVVDAGSWFRADRAAQSAADAAALAGAQALPESPSEAKSVAADYAVRNGGGLTKMVVSSRAVANDTITVQIARNAPGFFAKIFGIANASVGAKASARSGTPGEARYVAPITVSEKHPMLKCKPLPCSTPTTIQLAHMHEPGDGNAAGAFGLINLDRDDNGSAGAPVLADWILHGFDEYMPLDRYNSVPSAKFNSSSFREALDLRIGTELLFPVFRSIEGSGENARFDIIGWVGFRVTSFSGDGDDGTVSGSFTRMIVSGIQGTSSTGKDFGARAIALVE